MFAHKKESESRKYNFREEKVKRKLETISGDKAKDVAGSSRSTREKIQQVTD